MATEHLAAEATPLSEKMMDMSLDDMIKISKKTTASKSKRHLRREVRSSIRQGVLAQRRSNFHNNQFPVAKEVARKAASKRGRKEGCKEGCNMALKKKPRFKANDGKMKLKAMLPTHFASEIHSGNLQNLGTFNAVPNQNENAAPSARMAMTRRVHSLGSLTPYQGNWTTKVRLTNKGNLRSYRNAKGEGHVFKVELTDEEGAQIQATMFNEAANKFYPKFELGKVYYISKGYLKVANRQFKTVHNDYEMILNENAIVEEADGEAFVPETKFNFIKVDQLGSYVNKRELVDVVGIVQNVSSILSIRRKSDNETIPKRVITIADDSNKTVAISMWNDRATNVGQELLNLVETAPVVAIKCLKVGDFQGVSLSTNSRSTVLINPDLPESKKLRSWYDSEGKGASMASVGSDLSSSKAGSRSMYSDRVNLSHITNDPALGQDKPVFFSIQVYISYIKPDRTMWYRACKTCNKKVTEAIGSGYWCEWCQKNDDQCSLRYCMTVKVSDHSGEAWLSVFNEHAEKVIGCTADELDMIKKEEGDERYRRKLKEATWVPHLFQVSVAPTEYMSKRRQIITVRAQMPLDCSAESRHLLEEIAKMSVS